MARLVVLAALVLALASGCAGPAAHDAVAPVPPSPAPDHVRYVDGVQEASPSQAPAAEASRPTDATATSATAAAPAPCAFADGIPFDDPFKTFDTLGKQAVTGPVPQDGTLYEQCPNAFRWATTKAAPDGLHMAVHLSSSAKECYEFLFAAGKDSKPGPHGVLRSASKAGAGWSEGGTGSAARVEVLGAGDTNTVLGPNGEWATGGMSGGRAADLDLEAAADGVASWANDFTNGWAFVFGVVCDGPLAVSQATAGHVAHLFDEQNLQGGAVAGAEWTYAAIEAQASADLPTNATVLAGSFGETWRMTLDTPQGQEQATVLPTDTGEYAYHGPGGHYAATVDLVPSGEASAWWFLLASSSPVPSLGAVV